MTVDTLAFSPGTALAGGALIGLAAVLFVLLNGRIAGISGILGGLLSSDRGDRHWRLAFLAGLLAAPLAWRAVTILPPMQVDAGYLILIIAGVLVGASTRYASGCTSGHGVCGLARLSPRSLVATLAFMAAGVVTVFLMRHGSGGLT